MTFAPLAGAGVAGGDARRCGRCERGWSAASAPDRWRVGEQRPAWISVSGWAAGDCCAVARRDAPANAATATAPTRPIFLLETRIDILPVCSAIRRPFTSRQAPASGIWRDSQRHSIARTRDRRRVKVGYVVSSHVPESQSCVSFSPSWLSAFSACSTCSGRGASRRVSTHNSKAVIGGNRELYRISGPKLPPPATAVRISVAISTDGSLRVNDAAG